MFSGPVKTSGKDEIMREFDMSSGTCFCALVCAIDEAKAMGIEPNTRDWFSYVDKRKYEIREGLENKTYRFSAADRI